MIERLIITTIQKLNYVIRRFAGKEDTPRYKKLIKLKFAFVVDECHRAVSQQKKKELELFFRNSLWYGFTGTPIFAENSRYGIGNKVYTTKAQYGEALHEYTVKNAIHDKAVLGFQVEYKSTIPEMEMDAIVKHYNPSLDVRRMTAEERKIRFLKITIKMLVI